MAKNDQKKVVAVKELQGSHEEWLHSIITAQQEQPRQKLLQKVPRILQETKDYPSHYAPRVVSIGPYHHRDQKLWQMNKLKLKTACKFVLCDKQLLQGLFEAIFEIIKDVRNFYAVSSSADDQERIPDDEEFTRMILLDGCFILYFVKCIVKSEGHKECGMQTHHIPFVQQDLFLLENQLPFTVLKVLMLKSTILPQHEWETKMSQFIQQNMMVPEGKQSQVHVNIDLDVRCPAHLLELLHQEMVCPRDHESCQENSYTFRNVKELIAAGIHLKPLQTHYLTEIRYEPHCLSGCLKIHPITVDDATKAKLFNLIAYETCPDASDERCWVTSYVCFLDSLIDHPDDVKELRSVGILHNHLGSDDEVAKLFNEIGSELVPHPCAYQLVKQGIQNHYENKWLTYTAQFRHQHLKNPWTLIALIAGFLALFFTGIQTYYQIWSPPSPCDPLCKYLKKKYHIGKTK